jgi:hypothetical protein
MEPLRPNADRRVLEFAKTHVFWPSDVNLMKDGICRLNPQLARAVAQQLLHLHDITDWSLVHVSAASLLS